MYTERQAIQDELQDIRRENQALRDENQALRDRRTELLKRLRELDERDMGDNVSYDGLKYLTEQLNVTVANLATLVPKVTISDVLQHVSQDVDKEQVIENKVSEEVEETETDIVLPNKDELKKRKKAIEGMSRERAASTVLQIMEEKKEAKTKEIEREFYARTGRRYANFYEVLTNTIKMFPEKLEKRKGGFYTYKE